MNTKYIAGGIGLLVILIASSVAISAKKPAPRAATPQPTTEVAKPEPVQPIVPAPTKGQPATQPQQPTAPKKQGYTLSDVAQHKTESDCWTAVNGVVYNVTQWIAKHPGGKKEIIRMCGIDASRAFNGQHGGDAKPENILAGFEIGILN